jgi:hypothetical protein
MKAIWNFVISILIFISIQILISFELIKEVNVFIVVIYFFGLLHIGIGFGKLFKYLNNEKQ